MLYCKLDPPRHHESSVYIPAQLSPILLYSSAGEGRCKTCVRARQRADTHTGSCGRCEYLQPSRATIVVDIFSGRAQPRSPFSYVPGVVSGFSSPLLRTAETGQRFTGHHRAAERQQGRQKRAHRAQTVHGVLERELTVIIKSVEQCLCVWLRDAREPINVRETRHVRRVKMRRTLGRGTRFAETRQPYPSVPSSNTACAISVRRSLCRCHGSVHLQHSIDCDLFHDDTEPHRLRRPTNQNF